MRGRVDSLASWQWALQITELAKPEPCTLANDVDIDQIRTVTLYIRGFALARNLREVPYSIPNSLRLQVALSKVYIAPVDLKVNTKVLASITREGLRALVEQGLTRRSWQLGGRWWGRRRECPGLLKATRRGKMGPQGLATWACPRGGRATSTTLAWKEWLHGNGDGY